MQWNEYDKELTYFNSILAIVVVPSFDIQLHVYLHLLALFHRVISQRFYFIFIHQVCISYSGSISYLLRSLYNRTLVFHFGVLCYGLLFFISYHFLFIVFACYSVVACFLLFCYLSHCCCQCRCRCCGDFLCYFFIIAFVHYTKLRTLHTATSDQHCDAKANSTLFIRFALTDPS